jgi:aminopeptidase S
MKTLALLALLTGCVAEVDDLETVEEEVVVFPQQSWLANGGFESGMSPWTGGTRASGVYAHSGSWFAMLSGEYTATMSQNVSIPNNAATAKLRFYLDITTQEPANVAYDKIWLKIHDRDRPGTLVRAPMIWSTQSRSSTPGEYLVSPEIDLSSAKGKNLKIEFMTQPGSYYYTTTFRIDDVSLTGTLEQVVATE